MRSSDSFSYIYLYTEQIDFRKGIFSLSGLIDTYFNKTPFDSSLLFLFRNKKRDSIKAVYWDKSGFAMWVKVLEKEKFPWPKKQHEPYYTLTKEQINYILSGIDPWKIKKHQELEFTLI